MALEVEQVRALFVEIGPLHDLDQVSEFDGGDSWAVLVDEDVVTFEHDDERRVLVLAGEVGRPAEDRRAQVQGALLQYNFAWRETGGVRMALDGPDGTVVQMYDLRTDQLDSARLGEVVREFVTLLRDWRELLGRAPSASGSAADASNPAVPSGAIWG